MVVALLVVAAAIAILFDPPSALIEFVGDEGGTSQDGMWASVILGGLVFACFIGFATLVSIGLPEHLSIGPFAMTSRPDEHEGLGGARAALRELTERVEEQQTDVLSALAESLRLHGRAMEDIGHLTADVRELRGYVKVLLDDRARAFATGPEQAESRVSQEGSDVLDLTGGGQDD